tara:strand:- start:4 stop:651 length:648 start_codon:yes stop_codon:yes gene_type:complete
MDKDDVLNEIFNSDPLGLLNVKPKPSPVKDETGRLRDSFQQIINFYEEHNREPLPGKGIQEFQLYSRLKNLRIDKESHPNLSDLDTHGLLNQEEKEINSIDDIFNDDSLGVLESDTDIFELKHVPKEKELPDYIATRKSCSNFQDFEHYFKQCHSELRQGKRKLTKFKKEQQIEKGYFFVLKGVLLYVAEVGKRELEKGKRNARSSKTRKRHEQP